MAHKKFGGWILTTKLIYFFAQIKIANQLWWYNGEKDRAKYFFFIGRYEKKNDDPKARLYTFIFLFISIQIGIDINFKKEI